MQALELQVQGGRFYIVLSCAADLVGYWVVVTRHPQLSNSDGVAPHKSVACETVFCLVLIERS